jgi:uncharacterized protein (TIGR00375 family)
MKVIADLHIHSRYSRACSRDLTLPNIGAWADKKGIAVIGTGDFTHPKWIDEIDNELEEVKSGLFQLKNHAARSHFLLTSEVSSIYKQDDKVRRIHNLLLAPSVAAVRRLITALEARGVNLKADGRPIMGLHADELLKICKDADQAFELAPAHAWTPHFGVFGSLSGFDSLQQAFGDQAKHIFAIETGLSSDPKMNWQVSGLDAVSLISNSDAHSLRKIGREANVFDLEPESLSFSQIMDVIKGRDPNKFLYTIEFFPEEGKYHLDGHRDHSFSCLPAETNRLGGLCPVCGRKLLQGVLHRVDDLADRQAGFTPPRAIPYKSVIPLEEIIAETYGVGTASKKVLAAYERLVAQRPEFDLLLALPRQELETMAGPDIAESIIRVREGRVSVEPGYDGVFGKIKIYGESEHPANKRSAQKLLF